MSPRHHSGPATALSLDFGQVIHTCGNQYDALKWDDCPYCDVDENGGAALVCFDCTERYYGPSRVEPCTACGSGNTYCIVEGETV